MIGTICVLVSFPFIFLPPIGLDVKEEQLSVTVYYSIFFIVLNFGWATAQTSHLAMIPEMSGSENNQINLTAIRNAATAVSNILAYCTTWIFFEYGELDFFK